MNYVGDYQPGATVILYFNTFTSDDPSASSTITNFANTDVHIHKGSSLTQRNNAAGVTIDIDVDAITGGHFIEIDTSDNTVADFFTAGSDYNVRIEGTTVDAATINAFVGSFSLDNRMYAGKMVATTIATLASQTSFTLTAGSADNSAYVGCVVTVSDIASGIQRAQGICSAYTGATKTVTLASDPGIFTMAASDNVSIANVGLQPTVVGRQVDVTATGAAGIDWGNVENKTTANDLTQTDIQLVDTCTTNTDLVSAAAVVNEWETQSQADPTGFHVNVLEVSGVAEDIATATAVADVPTVAEFNARTLVAASYFDPAADTVATVTTVSNQVTANVTAISGDTTAADNLETAFDDTAGPVPWMGILDQGTAQSASATTVVLRAAAAFGDDTLNGALVMVHGSTQGYWQSRIIQDYTLSSDTATVTTWDVTPSGTITYKVFSHELFAVWDRALTGSTHNITTSAGRRLRGIQEFQGYEGGAIWIDTVNGTAGTTDFENGTVENPVDSIADANTLAASLNMTRFSVVTGSTITFAATQSGQTFFGENWTLALGGQSIVGTTIRGATVSGVASGTGTTQIFKDCLVGATSHVKGTHLVNCGLSGNQTAVEAGDFFFDQCHSAVAGTGSVTFDFGAALNSSNLNVRHHSGGWTIANMGAGTGTYNASFEGNGQIVWAASCSATSNASIRGNWKITDNASAAVTETLDDNQAGVDAILVDTNELQTDWTDGGRLDLIQDAILVDTSEIGAAGAGLTAINLPNQTMDIIGDITGNLSGSVGSVTGAVGSVTGAVGSVTGNVGGNVTGSVGSNLELGPAEVNAEMVDVLRTDTNAEPGQGTPGATLATSVKIDYLYKAWRNRSTQDATTYELYNDDAVTVDQKATVSDDGSTADKGEVATGP